MRPTPSLARRLAAPLLGAALVGALAAAGWVIHRGLPHEAHEGRAASRREPPPSTALRIRLRPASERALVSAEKVPVLVYPINMAAARNEFYSEQRPGQRFEEFAARLMGERQPVTAELDERGEAVVSLTPGRWWVHVTLEGPREVTWRLPVNVSGREKTVELTAENAYARAKKF
jgi:hypothetical protein